MTRQKKVALARQQKAESDALCVRVPLKAKYRLGRQYKQGGSR